MISIGATCILSLILLCAGISRMTALPPPSFKVKRKSTIKKIHDISASRSFGITLMVVGVLVLVRPGIYLTGAIMAFSAALFLTGFFVRYSEEIKNCNCFGTLTPSKKLVDVISITGLVCVSIISFRPVGQNAVYADLHDTFSSVVLYESVSSLIVCIFGGLYLSAVALFVFQSRTQYMKMFSNDTDDVPPYEPSMIIGDMNDQEVVVREVLTEGKPCLVIKVSKKCNICNQMIDVLLDWIDKHKNILPIALISDSKDLVTELTCIGGAGYSVIFDTKNRFESHLRLIGSPLAVLLNGTTGEILSPAMRTPEGVMKLAEESYKMALEIEEENIKG